MTRLLEHLQHLREERRAPSGPTPVRRDPVLRTSVLRDPVLRDPVRPATDGFRDCRGVWHAWQEDR